MHQEGVRAAGWARAPGAIHNRDSHVRRLWTMSNWQRRWCCRRYPFHGEKRVPCLAGYSVEELINVPARLRSVLKGATQAVNRIDARSPNRAPGRTCTVDTTVQTGWHHHNRRRRQVLHPRRKLGAPALECTTEERAGEVAKDRAVVARGRHCCARLFGVLPRRDGWWQRGGAALFHAHVRRPNGVFGEALGGVDLGPDRRLLEGLERVPLCPIHVGEGGTENAEWSELHGAMQLATVGAVELHLVLPIHPAAVAEVRPIARTRADTGAVEVPVVQGKRPFGRGDRAALVVRHDPEPTGECADGAASSGATRIGARDVAEFVGQEI